MARKSIDKWQFGDFQTPDDLARKVVRTLKSNHDINPALIVEPSCGTGSFVRAAIEAFPDTGILAFDVNASYVSQTLTSISDYELGRVSIEQGDFFVIDWKSILAERPGDILIIGNPPWVTSSELGLLNSKNLPEKTNFQGRRGIEAITGSGNFDISEWMLLRYVDWLSKRQGCIAILCKYSVARKVMKSIRKRAEQDLFGHVYRIDAQRYFAAAVNACLFVLTTSKAASDCEVYENLTSKAPSHVIGERDGQVVSDIVTYERRRDLKGQDPAHIWRSGVKHDCSKVMELEPTGKGFTNGFGEYLELEEAYVYPLLKSSDVGNSRVGACRKFVIVTQTCVGEDTAVIKSVAPKTWAYLEFYADILNNRRSSIYRGKPPFSIFGIGEYTLKAWKVAISALYKHLGFRVVGPIDGKPVIFDDTVNFLSFDSAEEAGFFHELLLARPALEFLESNIFWDEKRPITTDILRRLSLKAVARKLGRESEYIEFVNDAASRGDGQLQLGIAERSKRYGSAVNT